MPSVARESHCLYGLALCAWRQRRWDHAEAMLTTRVWLDPTGPWDALACLEPVRARTRLDPVVTGTQRRPPIFGPVPWTTLAGADWCHFDRWFAIVARDHFGGDLDALEAELIRRLRSLHGRGDVEAKLSHLADLRYRLGAAGVDAAVLAAANEPDKATVTRARRKILDQGLEDRAMTPAMRDTPSARLRRRPSTATGTASRSTRTAGTRSSPGVERRPTSPRAVPSPSPPTRRTPST